MNIANLIQSQTLATLLQAMSPGASLAPGGIAEATLLSVDPDGRAIAQLGDFKLALVLAGPVAKQAVLQPGATLVLNFEAAETPGEPLARHARGGAAAACAERGQASDRQ